jgi:TonB family protein
MMLKTASLPQALTLSLLLHLAVLLSLHVRAGYPAGAAIPGPLRLTLMPVAAMASLSAAPAPAATAKAVKVAATAAAPLAASAEPVSLAPEIEPAPMAPQAAAASELGDAATVEAIPADALVGAGDEAESLGWNMYLPARLLDGPSLPLDEILLPEPDEVEPAQGIVAEAEIKVYVNEQGEVDAVEVVRAEPPGVLEDMARAAFMDARFQPGMQNGRAVRHYKRIVINRVL